MRPWTKPLTWTMRGAGQVAAVLISLSACSLVSLGGGDTGRQSRSDAVDVAVQYTFPSAGSARCTGRMRWVFTPAQLTGSNGRRERISSWQGYDVASAATRSCVVRAEQRGLARGTWRIGADTLGPCDVDLQESRTVYFRDGEPGCTMAP